MAKPRKKKPTTKGRMTYQQARVADIVKSVYRDLYFVGSSFTKPNAVNANKLYYATQGGELLTARKVLLEQLITIKTNWPLWVGCFFDTPNGIAVSSADSLWEGEFLYSFGDRFDERVNIIVDSIIASEAEEHISKETLIGYGYFFSHCDIYDMTGTDQQLVNLFLPYMDKQLAKGQNKSPTVKLTTDILIESITYRGGVAKDGKIEEYVLVEEEAI